MKQYIFVNFGAGHMRHIWQMSKHLGDEMIHENNISKTQAALGLEPMPCIYEAHHTNDRAVDALRFSHDT